MSASLPGPTARIRWRLWTPDDLDLARALWGDTRVTALIGGPWDDARIRHRLDAELAAQRDHGVAYWPIFSDVFLGCAGLRPYDEAMLEVGVHLRPEASGRGLATEATRACVTHAFERPGVAAVFAGHHPENAASRRLLEKLGFRFTRHELYAPTGLQHPSYLVTREEWRP